MRKRTITSKDLLRAARWTGIHLAFLACYSLICVCFAVASLVAGGAVDIFTVIIVIAGIILSIMVEDLRPWMAQELGVKHPSSLLLLCIGLVLGWALAAFCAGSVSLIDPETEKTITVIGEVRKLTLLNAALFVTGYHIIFNPFTKYANIIRQKEREDERAVKEAEERSKVLYPEQNNTSNP
jgi:uncharacterized protein YacL